MVAKREKKMTHEELVRLCCGVMIEELCSGNIRSGVLRCIQYILSWDAQENRK